MEVTTATIYYSTYRYTKGFSILGKKTKYGALRCAWCDKNVTRLGSKRLKTHLENHEKNQEVSGNR